MVMAIYDYKIGISSGAMSNVETVCGVPPIGTMEAYPMRYVLGDGSEVSDGMATVLWKFSLLPPDGYAYLRGVCPGVSAWLYIKTRTPDEDFHTYSVCMHWPEDVMSKRNNLGYYADIEFSFTNAILVS
jgi:hypothetical protein